MKTQNIRAAVIVALLLAGTWAALAHSRKAVDTQPGAITAKTGIVKLDGTLTQDKILQGGNGIVGLSLTLTADDVVIPGNDRGQNVDMVVVLDRSGSMEGEKIRDAKHAVLELLATLSPGDRFGLVSYADDVSKHCGLVEIGGTDLGYFTAMVNRIAAGGGTNLGGGLQEGIDILQESDKIGNMGKVILLSDGLANQGITDPAALGVKASQAVKGEFAVSTVGVGADFNEYLMTRIADQGIGTYHYLENPRAFAAVFQDELHRTKVAAATGVEITIPLPLHAFVVEASGYPVSIRNNAAVFYPGDLMSGQTRTLFITLRVPTDSTREFTMSNVTTRYRYEGKQYAVSLSEPFVVACVEEEKDVFASIESDVWEKKVLQDDYNRLRESVAKDMRDGKKEQALGKIEQYYQEKKAVNAVVASPHVAANLDEDLEELRDTVNETFEGTAGEVQRKQKVRSKAMQYEGYKERRDKK